MKQPIYDEPGVWLPLSVVEKILRLDLISSRYRILLTIMVTSSRFGGRPAKLGIDDLVELTGLSRSTVKASVADLVRQGLVNRPSRYRQLAVPLLTSPVESSPGRLFTRPQEFAMRRAFRLARKLLRSDPLDLPLSEEWAGKLGLESPITFRQVEATVTPKTASLWVGAVLSLLADERVQGRPLTL